MAQLQKLLLDLTTKTKALKEVAIDSPAFLDWFSTVQDVIQATDKKENPANIAAKQKTALKDFKRWAVDNGVVLDRFSFGSSLKEGNGIVLTEDVKEDELLIVVPSKLILSCDVVREKPEMKAISVDPMVQVTPSLLLALFILREKSLINSFWLPYLNVLPRTFTTPLFWNIEELRLLNGSPAQHDALQLLLNCVRQYIYLYPKISSGIIPGLKTLFFTLPEFLWAFSCVLTRQNGVPSKQSQQQQLALIPVWDMCNHEEGKITTYYDLSKQESECFAMRNFKQGEQFFIYYGKRPNSELLLFSGFINPSNVNDSIKISLSLPKGESASISEKRNNLLSKLSLRSPQAFFLKKRQLTEQLVAFCRVACLTESELDFKSQTDQENLLRSLSGGATSQSNEDLSVSYLTSELERILAQYPKNSGDANAKSRTEISKLANALVDLEKNILSETIAMLKKQPEQPTTATTTTDSNNKQEKKETKSEEAENDEEDGEGTESTTSTGAKKANNNNKKSGSKKKKHGRK